MGIAHIHFRMPLHGNNPWITRAGPLDGFNYSAGSSGGYAQVSPNLVNSLTMVTANL